MKLLIRPYQTGDQEEVIALWQSVFPDTPAHNDSYQDIQRKLTVQPECFLVAVKDTQVIGTIMAGFDGHRGWLNYVVVHPEFRQQSIGRNLVAAAEQALLQLGCSKVNLQIRQGNQPVQKFYEKLGYVVEPRIDMGKIIRAG